MERIKDINFLVFCLHNNNYVYFEKYKYSNTDTLCCISVFDFQQDRFNEQKNKTIGGKMSERWDELARITFIQFVLFSLIIHNVLILSEINDIYTKIIISLVTLGLAVLMVYFTLNHSFKLERKLKEKR